MLALPARLGAPCVTRAVEGAQGRTWPRYLSIQQAINLNVQLMEVTEWAGDVTGSGAAVLRPKQWATAWRGHYPAGKNDGKPGTLACVGWLWGD